MDALPADGVPRKFPVLASRVDAWNKFSQVPIGAVYLRRPNASDVQALNVVCPHAGCFVDFIPGRMLFECPCHKSVFTLDGQIASKNSPAPRPMDSLTVELRNGKEVWVSLKTSRPGTRKKYPSREYRPFSRTQDRRKRTLHFSRRQPGFSIYRACVPCLIGWITGPAGAACCALPCSKTCPAARAGATSGAAR